MGILQKWKRWAITAVWVALVSAFIAGCGSVESPTVPEADALEIVALADDARSLVREMVSESVLRQLNISTDSITFRFTDAAATKGINVFAGVGESPEQWRVVVVEVSPLLGHPTTGLDLAALMIGPESVLALARNHWPDGDLRANTLTGDGRDLVWNVSWNLPAGVVSAWVDAVTGEFTPSEAPPVIPPPVATAGP